LGLFGKRRFGLVDLRNVLLGSLLIASCVFQDLDHVVENNIWVGFLGILEQSHSDLEEFEFVNLFDDLKIELDRLSKSASSWTCQSEVGSDGAFVRNGLIFDVQRNGDLVVGEWLDLKVNWDVHGTEHFGSLVGEVASDGAAWFVWPVGVVSHLDLFEDGLSW